MDDSELLELAAKAAGDIVVESATGFWRASDGKRWDPLEDDGDALRLAVKLGLCILIESGHVLCTRYYAEPQNLTPHYERLGDSAAAATRRAIVRAAAEIGKGLRPFPTVEEMHAMAGTEPGPMDGGGDV